jgi:aminopeptidase N
MRPLLAALAAFAVLAAPSAALARTAGSPGLGDPFFPLAGNGGYDVHHYGLALAYDPGTKVLDGRAAVKAVAKQDLDRFDLDLRGFDVSRLRVNGRRAAFTRDGQELAITPARRLRAGRHFVVTVRYTGVPDVITDPDGSAEGWVPTPDGAFVVGEPQGAPGWFPANDNPRDKARYDLAITVPRGNVAMGNGVLVRRSDHGDHSTWLWHEGAPMASYLATATNGKFAFTQQRGPHGLPVYDAVDTGFSPEDQAKATRNLAREPEILEFLSGLYGPYPFEAAGAIVDDAPDVGYALESQTKPNYDSVPSVGTVVHELSHQWVGDSVTLKVWPDIWLHEGFATYSTWLWDEKEDPAHTAQDTFDEVYASWDWTQTAIPPSAAELFGGPVYDRGAMTLHALRTRIGDRAFFRLLREWTARNRYGNVRTSDFVALAERVSGRDLDGFFAAWLTGTTAPPRG